MGDAYNSAQTASAPHHTSIAIDRAPQRAHVTAPPFVPANVY